MTSWRRSTPTSSAATSFSETREGLQEERRRACLVRLGPFIGWHTSVLLGGFLYGPDGNNSEGAGRSPTSLRCLDWKTGEIKWTESKLGFNGLIAVGSRLLVLTETGDLVLVEASPQSYRELGSTHVIEGRAFTAPSFANGRVFVRNVRGDVVSLDFSGK